MLSKDQVDRHLLDGLAVSTFVNRAGDVEGCYILGYGDVPLQLLAAYVEQGYAASPPGSSEYSLTKLGRERLSGPVAAEGGDL